MHLFNKKAYDIAEKEIHRAIRLNPYENRFKIHLVWFLCKFKKFDEAKEIALKILEEESKNDEVRKVLEYIDEYHRTSDS